MDRETLEQKLALAPKYGQNQAWLLLNSVLAQGEEVQDNGPGPKRKPKPPTSSSLKVDMKLFEAVPKTVLPNIEVKPRAKIPRGPRINWLNRSIALYLKFIGEDFLGLKSSASLFQEVQFNMSFCRCAIKAAVAHETHAFKSSPNSQKYHVSLTRQPPALANVDFDTLSTLCQQYSQPVPAHHPQHAERSTAAMGAVDTSTGVASQTVTGTGTHEAVQGLQQQQQNINQGYEALGLDPTASDSPQCAADGANARSEPSGAAEQPAAGSEDGHCSASVLDSRIQEPEISGAVHGKLKRLREACEEEEGAPSAVKAYVDALFESDEDWPAHVAASGCDHVHDINIPESLPHMPELSGGAAVAGSEEEYVPGSPGSADVGPCEQARVGAAVATGSSAEKAASGASQVWSRVREFVSMCLEPWLVSGAVDDEESEVILDKCVSKVLSAHAGRKDAAFLDAEGERIQALVAKYADFVVSKSKK